MPPETIQEQPPQSTEAGPTFRLTGKQSAAFDFLDDPGLTRYLFDGGARSGKTFVICLKILELADRYPENFKALICRQTLKAAKATVWADTLRPILSVWPGWNWNETPNPHATSAAGAQLIIDGLDNKDRIEKLLGDEYNLIFINEATQVSRDMMGTLLTRLARRAYSRDGEECKRFLAMDCNPKHRRHWVHRVGVERVDADTLEPLANAHQWGRVHWVPLDNPNLSEDYIDTLRNLPGVKRRRMYAGEWAENEGMVFEDFEEEVHVFREFPEGFGRWPVIRGIDFGFSNPFVCLWGRYDGDKRLWIYRERYKSKMIVADHAEEIKKYESAVWTVADHDAEDRATLHKTGINTHRAFKSIKPGLDAVTARLRSAGDGRPRLFIHDSCQSTINEFYAYIWPDGIDGKPDKEVPVDDFNHSMDALRYMVCKLDGIRRGGGRALI